MLLVEKMEQAKRGGTELDPASAINVPEKRALVMKGAADAHGRLAEEGAFEHVLVAAATWVPVDHALAADGSESSPVDMEASLQGAEKEECACAQSAALKLMRLPSK